jgi:UDP-GlcNAc:undecaprenyl-phosphate GlcNAc-1-phosphate transferase
MIDIIPYLFILTVVIVIVVVKVLSSFANQLCLIDTPNHRKQHDYDVPLVGGIAMFVGFVVGVMIFVNGYSHILTLVLFSFGMLVIGVVDDMSEMTVNARMFFQIIFAILILSITDVELQSLGNIFNTGNLFPGDFALIVTVLAIIGGVNAFNVMDGIDGLASGLGMIVFSSVLAMAYMANADDIVPLVALYLFILLPFIFFNLSDKHKVFMGDAGTMFIGLGIVWILIISSQGEKPIFTPVTALWVFAVPLIDIVSVVCLRIKNRKSPFLPDCNHIHFQMKSRHNYSDNKILVIILLIAFFIATIGILGNVYSVPEWIMFDGFIGLFFVYLVYLFKG